MRLRKLVAPFAAALALAGAGSGIAPSPASAHQGDWYTQYVQTYNNALSRCRANWGGYCPDLWYDGSGTYDAHSRYFVWRRTTAGGRICTDTYYIGHTYAIWAQFHDC